MSTGATIPDVTHHRAAVNGTELHYVAAGTGGAPVLLVHGFPDSGWTFHKLIPRLASAHRVFAVDLRGFGDSSHEPDIEYGSAVTAEDLHRLVVHLEVGPVHVLCQDISGGTICRLAATHPDSISSLALTETGFAGYGLEAFADVTHGGSWHIGVLATAGVPDMLLTGRERQLIGDWAFPAMTRVADAVTAADIAEFVRVYAQPGGWNGAAGLYRSMLDEGGQLRELTQSPPLSVPVAAITAGGGGLSGAAAAAITSGRVVPVPISGAGHYLALEAPEQLADALLSFLATVDAE